MALSTVEEKLLNAEYESGYQFAMDIRLIWSNSFFYNASISDLYSATMELSTFFEGLFKGNEDLIVGEHKNLVEDLYRKINNLSKGIKGIQNKPASIPVKAPVKVLDKPLGLMEKQQLCANIKKLDPKYLKGVLDIVKECMDIKGDELEFDIDKLPGKVCRELEKYVKTCLQSSTRPVKNLKTIESRVVQEPNSLKAQEILRPVEDLASKNKSEVYLPEESESESSSTSESEEEIPSMQREETPQEFANYPNIIDFDKLY